MAACIATWSFSHTAVLKAQQLLSTNATSLDAVEEAIARMSKLYVFISVGSAVILIRLITVQENGRGTVN